jgi:ParB family chromosome partitioning protein
VKAGLKTIPALVREAGNQQRLELALVENLQREELNPMEQARGCDLLMRDFSLDQEKVATILGKSRPFVGNLVRLLRLDPEIQTLVEEGKISFGHAKVLAGLPRREDQLGLARLVIAEGLSVRETEARQARLKDAPAAASELAGRAPKKRRDPNVSAAEDRLRQVLGAEVRIAGGPERGAIRIEFTSAAELNRLFEILVRARPAPPPPLAAVKLPGSSPSPAPGER